MTGIIYYSKDGSTEILANLLREKYKAKVIRLVESTNRKGIFGFIKSGFQAVKKMQSKLVDAPWEKIKDWDTLYLCTPIWASNGTPAMNTFLANANLKGKNIIIVTVMADSNIAGARDCHDYLSNLVVQAGGKVEKCIGLHGASPGKCSQLGHIKKQFDAKL